MVDPTFRAKLAEGLVAQVEHGNWGAFLPAGGAMNSVSTSIVNAADALLVDPNTPPDTTRRLCAATEIEAAVGSDLREIVADLRAKFAFDRTSGFTCRGSYCEIYNGEFCYNRRLVFAREGALVRLVAVRFYCGRPRPSAWPTAVPPCRRVAR